jgi:hypothetical protein
MDRKISDLSIKEFEHLMKEIIHRELENFDPDEGLELRDEVKEELKQHYADKKSGSLKVIDAEEVFKKLGV